MKTIEKIMRILFAFVVCIAAGMYATVGIAFLALEQYIALRLIGIICSILMSNIVACQAEHIIKGVFI